MLNPLHALICSFILCLPAQAMSRRAPAPVVVPSPSPSSEPQASPVPSPLPSPSPQPEGTAKGVKFEPIAYYATPAEQVKIHAAGAKLNEVVQSACFHNFMAKAPLTWTNGKTPEQVATHLQSLSGTVPVRIYYRCMGSSLWGCTSAVAYRQPPEISINLNRAYFSTDMSDCEWAATLAHESLGHSLGGYDHSYKWTREREDTVPYVMGGRKDRYGGDAFSACCH